MIWNCWNCTDDTIDDTAIISKQQHIYVCLLFVYCLLWSVARVQACHEVLRELRKASSAMEDMHGQALYFCCCLDLLLESGKKMRDFRTAKSSCVFTKAASDTSWLFDSFRRLSAWIADKLRRFFSYDYKWSYPCCWCYSEILLECVLGTCVS